MTSDTQLEADLATIFAARDRDDMEPTIRALLAILDEHPEEASVLYAVGGAYDTAGQEETALSYYEHALGNGLHGDMLRKCYLQYGSTLRNVGRIEDSLTVFARARTEFPDSESLAIFEALTLHAAGLPSAALGQMLVLMADRFQSEEVRRYETSIRGNAAFLIALDAPDATNDAAPR
jgi:tetratricopeptide (TPR) repeat protein